MPGSVVGPAAADAPVERVRVARDVPAGRDGEQEERDEACMMMCQSVIVRTLYPFLNSVLSLYKSIYDYHCTAERRKNGEEDAEVAELVGEEAGERRREDEEDGDDGVDHGGLLHTDPQVLKGGGEERGITIVFSIRSECDIHATWVKTNSSVDLT